MFGGRGEIRTHGTISRPTVFKTVAINRALPLFRNLYMVVMAGIEPTPFFLMREAYRPSILHHHIETHFSKPYASTHRVRIQGKMCSYMLPYRNTLTGATLKAGFATLLIQCVRICYHIEAYCLVLTILPQHLVGIICFYMV